MFIFDSVKPGINYHHKCEHQQKIDLRRAVVIRVRTGCVRPMRPVRPDRPADVFSHPMHLMPPNALISPPMHPARLLQPPSVPTPPHPFLFYRSRLTASGVPIPNFQHPDHLPPTFSLRRPKSAPWHLKSSGSFRRGRPRATLSFPTGASLIEVSRSSFYFFSLP